MSNLNIIHGAHEAFAKGDVPGVLGLVLAMWGVRLPLHVVPDNLPRSSTVGLAGRGLSYTVLASLLTGIIFGLVPALQAARADVNRADEITMPV